MKLYVLLLVAVLSASGQTAQTGMANPNSPSTGTAADFLGTVVDVAGKPLEGVHVTLTVYESGRLPFGLGRDPVAIYGSMSNEKGRFSIPEVPPGTYDLTLEKRGYLMVPPEERGSFSGKQVQLKAGKRFTDVVLRMARRAIIAGRLLDEYGEPLTDARVSAKPAGSIENNWETVTTNDRGEFRLAVLPDKYLVAGDASSHGNAGIHLRGSKGDYQFTYFPGVATDKEASLVETMAGGVTGDIDFKAIKVATYTVEVEVTGIPQGAGSLSLHYASNGTSGTHFKQVDEKDGTASFLLGPLPAGTYHLTATYKFNETELQSRPTDVTIAISDVQGVLLPLAPELELNGTIEIKGGPATLEPVKRSVVLLPADGVSLAHAESGPDGVFKIASIPPDRYIVMVDPLPKNGFIQSIELNEKPVKDLKLDLSGISGIGRLKIVVSLNGAHISGKLDQRGQTGQAKVILVSRSEDFNPANFRMTAPEEDGSYSFEGIAPGEYVLVAFRLASDIRNMPELIQRNKGAAVILEIQEGDKIVKDLKVISEETDVPQK